MSTENTKQLHPESFLISGGYEASPLLGSIKPPIFQTSTFKFESAEVGEKYFRFVYDVDPNITKEQLGNIYSRLDNPNLKILEEKLSYWDKGKDCAVFSSGMAVISSIFLNFLKPGDLLLHSLPVYGGTDKFIEKILKKYDINVVSFMPNETKDEIIEKVQKAPGNLKMIYTETPANPTNSLIDIEMCKTLKNSFSNKDDKVLLVVDNTYMGPIWSQPIDHGADLVVYSATKYIGGHSDLIAGACVGKDDEIIGALKTFRTLSGNMCDPWTCWLMTRSLETLKVRMEQQAKSAEIIAKRLCEHKNVEKVYYLGLLDENDPQFKIYKRQYSSPGAMISFDIKGGQKEAYKFLDSLEMVNLAVSLGSTESLAQHPDKMTHIGLDFERKVSIGLTEKMIRLSIGLENVEDIWTDLNKSLNQIDV